MGDTMGPEGPEYEAVVMTCFACKTREETQTRFQGDENADLAGVKFGVREVFDG